MVEENLRDLVASIVRYVQSQGLPTSSQYLAAYDRLKDSQDRAFTAVCAGAGKQLLSVNAGEAASWNVSMTNEQWLTVANLAFAQLNGQIPIVRKTTARYLY